MEVITFMDLINLYIDVINNRRQRIQKRYIRDMENPVVRFSNVEFINRFR